MRFLIFGAGYSAQAFAQHYQSDIYGTTRNKDRFTTLEKAGIKPLLFPNDEENRTLKEKLYDTTHLVISIAPDADGDIILKHQGLLDSMPHLQWIGYLSTIGVYGDHQGKWIDETATCNPSLKRNFMRLQAEAAWKQLAEHYNIPIAILRLGGIYGPHRNVFVKLQNGKAQRIVKTNQVFNRIHVDDIAGVIHTFANSKQDGLFNIVDNEPAPPQDVIAYAANLMGVEVPPEIPFEKADMSEMARTFYGDNKRILNQKLLETGYTLKQPDYRTALKSMWQSGDW